MQVLLNKEVATELMMEVGAYNINSDSAPTNSK